MLAWDVMVNAVDMHQWPKDCCISREALASGGMHRLCGRTVAFVRWTSVWSAQAAYGLRGSRSRQLRWLSEEVITCDNLETKVNRLRDDAVKHLFEAALFSVQGGAFTVII